MIFASKTAAAVWKESNCDRCFNPAQMEQRLTGKGRGCMILNAALTRKTPPAEIMPGRSGAQMSDAFRCTAKLLQPAVLRRPVAEPKQEMGLFDILDAAVAAADMGDHA